jgi:hypothetical protein
LLLRAWLHGIAGLAPESVSPEAFDGVMHARIWAVHETMRD